LYYAIITSPANHSRMETIRSGLARLADPRGLSEADADALISSLPGTAWMAYSIHGNETSGSDAALAVVHHLAAAQGEAVESMLQNLVILIDPMQNPDGRNRWLQQVAEHRGTQPSVDDQSALHAGYWPGGRTNHYGFDLNRDWALGVNPEATGRIREASTWHPLLFVDAHEMGSQDTYLFSPQRSPVNPNIPANRKEWHGRFAKDQAAAFDRYNWAYYTGEWNEGWYPGYSDAWGPLRGAIGILYEQARITEDGVRRPGGAIHTYREAVHHQAVSSLANLSTLQANVANLRRDVLAERRLAVSPDGPFAKRSFAILPTDNRSRLDGFLDLMELQGFEIYRTTKEFRASGKDQFGLSFQKRSLPVGTILIPNRQPEGHHIAALLEFDTRLTPGYVNREREAILRTGTTTIYDVTAWSITMMHGLEALSLESGLPPDAELLGMDERGGADSVLEASMRTVAWAINGSDDASVSVAARLMERGVEVRAAMKAFQLGGVEMPRGSPVVLRNDNRSFPGDLEETLAEVASAVGLTAASLTTGLGEGELPDLGGGGFQRLEPPRIAILSGPGISAYDQGSQRYMLDHRIGIRHTQLNGLTPGTDLRRYNVIVLPHRTSAEWSTQALSTLETWVEADGTLIAVGSSAGQLAGSESSLSRVRLLRDVIGKLETYEDHILREWMAVNGMGPDSTSVWSHSAAMSSSLPWSMASDLKRPAEGLERLDRWQRMFMPAGAMLAGRTDQKHWLTFGTGGRLPVLFTTPQVFMSEVGVEAAMRAGAYRESPGAVASRVGWSVVPAGQEMDLRMSGLLWPEAGERLANSALVTREQKGKGQVILFATPPTFRASTMGTERLLVNAMIYGPGLGATPAIIP